MAELLVELAAKASAKMDVSDDAVEKLTGPKMTNPAKAAIRSVANVVTREVNGVLYCNLCGRGPFTKKGMFLHLSRLHRGEIRALLKDYLNRGEAR